MSYSQIYKGFTISFDGTFWHIEGSTHGPFSSIVFAQLFIDSAHQNQKTVFECTLDLQSSEPEPANKEFYKKLIDNGKEKRIESGPDPLVP